MEFLSSLVIAAIISGIFTLINAAFADKKAHKRLETWAAAQQEDLETAAKERELLISGMFVILRKLQGDNLNGELKRVIDDLNGFINALAHRTVARK